MAFTVNGELVEDSAVRAEIRALRPRYESMVRGMDPMQAEAQLREWCRENVIERVLLRQEAASDPEPLPADLVEEALKAAPDEPRAEVEIRLRVERLISKVTAKLSPPRRKDVTEYYRRNKGRFFRPEQVRAAHIFKTVDDTNSEAAALDAIEGIERDIQSGVSFEELASDLGYVPRGKFPREFEDLLFSLEVNQVSAIFRSRAGFHLAKIYERRPEGISGFEEVEEVIAAALLERKRERAIEAYLDRLKAKAAIIELSRGA
jgi:parvulin-like peptidyl-prolyl isomerase